MSKLLAECELIPYDSRKGYSYSNYIRSKRWKAIRAYHLLNPLNQKCKCCGKKDTVLQIHHKTYKRLFKEGETGDLITLCVSCHKGLHALQKKLSLSVEEATRKFLRPSKSKGSKRKNKKSSKQKRIDKWNRERV